VGELKAPDKPFDISKRAVWEAYEKVRANKGAPGVDKVSLADFEGSSILTGQPEVWPVRRA